MHPEVAYNYDKLETISDKAINLTNSKLILEPLRVWDFKAPPKSD